MDKYPWRTRKYAQSEKGKAARKRSYLKRKAEGKIFYPKRDSEARKKLNKYLESPRGRFCAARSRAKLLGRDFTIAEDNYYFLISMPCYYCGGNLNPKGVGLDRIDSSKGYTLENSVSCCKKCNTLKSDLLSKDEMKAIMSVLQGLRGKSRVWT